MFEVSPETALEYTKFCVILVFTWPPWPETSRLKKNLFNILSWIFSSLSFGLFGCLCNAIRYELNDYLEFAKTICVAVTCFQTCVKIFICKIHRSRLEAIHRQIKDFLKEATPREREMLQRYVKRCSLVHFAYNLCCVVAAFGFICGPLVLSQPLPTDARYPFSVENHPAKEIAYFHQVIVGLQCAAAGSVDCHAAFLIWYAGARLELLANEFENVTSDREFYSCIRKHQMLLKNAEEIVVAVRFIIVTTTIATTASIVTGSIHIISQQSLMVKAQFVFLDIGMAWTLFLSAWAAENLKNVCTAVGQGAYNAPWTQGSPGCGESILFVVQRSQNPIIISVASIVPALSLNYYSTFLSKAFSFFTTLSMMIDKVTDEI